MKIKFNTNLVVNMIIAGIVIVACLPLLHLLRSTSTVTSTTCEVCNSWEGNNLKPIDPEPDKNLPYHQYVKLKDSIATMRSVRDGDVMLGSSIILGIISINYGSVCDTCSLKSYLWGHNSKFGRKTGYITLRGWTLETRNDLGYIDEGKFYVKNGQGYIRKTIIDTSYTKADGATYNKIRTEDVPVKFRYDHKNNYLLIPISIAQADILFVIFIILIIIVFSYIIYLIAVFLHFIIDVSKGEIFTAKNVGRLRLIWFSLLCYPIYIYGLNYSMRLIFHDYFIPGVIVKDDLLPGLWMNLVLVIIFLLLYKAFRQGKKLKEDNDLTI